MAIPARMEPGTGSAYELRNWMDVGDLPPAVASWRAARMRTFRRVSSIVGGFGVGGIAGYLGLLLWPGVDGWAFPMRVELFLGIAVVVGIAEFFFSGFLAGWVASASLLKVRRVAVAGGNLRIETMAGATFEWPLKRVSTSSGAVAGGWYAVGLSSGRATSTFYVPAPIASTIANAPRE